MSYYSKQQLMLTFSAMAYFGSALPGTDKSNEKKIFAHLQRALQSWKPVKDQWEVVWGPAVFSLPGTWFDDSMMYVVRNLKQPEKYVVAIRGTNPVSIPNAVIWNLQVRELEDWPFGESVGWQPKLSRSTYFGLSILQALRPAKELPGGRQTLQEFFAKNLPKDVSADICFTGHSLGGVLASTLALWMKDLQGKQFPKDAKVSTVTIAAPTAGDTDFARYSNQRFAKGECLRIANAKDVVPHAWNVESLLQLYGLYLPYTFPDPFLAFFLMGIIGRALGKGYTQLEEAEIQPGETQKLLPLYPLQALYQHSVAYVKLMDMLEDIPLEELFPEPLHKLVRSVIRVL
ncbi:MAG: hypothetical protein AAF518_23675 [Spirochaetota bacterium]